MSSTRVKKQPRSASSNKSPVSGKQGGNSPVRDAETASQLYIKLKYNREKLCHTLDTYTLLARSKNPIRCLYHNSVMSIYCENEGKLLCTKCIFGRSEHKFHKVTPIDHRYELISKYVAKKHEIVSREIKAIQKAYEAINKSLSNEYMDAHNFLVYLMAKHNECHARLEESLLISQKMVMETLDTVRNKHQTVLLELAMLRENYNVDYLMSMVNQEGVNDEQKLVYQHAVCSTILAQNKFEGHLWEKQTSEIRTVAAEMAIVLENICGLLSGYTKDKTPRKPTQNVNSYKQGLRWYPYQADKQDVSHRLLRTEANRSKYRSYDKRDGVSRISPY